MNKSNHLKIRIILYKIYFLYNHNSVFIEAKTEIEVIIHREDINKVPMSNLNTLYRLHTKRLHKFRAVINLKVAL